MNPVRVLIVDDQSLIRDGLKTVLDLETNIRVCGVARNGVEAVGMISSLKPEVVLLDIRMPEMDGVQCTRVIKTDFPEIKVLMLTTFDDEEYIMNALAFGASGYILKDIEMNKLIEAILDVSQGKMVMPSQVAAKLARGLSKKISVKGICDTGGAEIDLTEREREIAGMLVQGFTNRQISAALYISEGTVRNYISNIYSKIGIGDRTKAVLYLKEKGIN